METRSTLHILRKLSHKRLTKTCGPIHRQGFTFFFFFFFCFSSVLLFLRSSVPTHMHQRIHVRGQHTSPRPCTLCRHYISTPFGLPALSLALAHTQGISPSPLQDKYLYRERPLRHCEISRQLLLLSIKVSRPPFLSLLTLSRFYTWNSHQRERERERGNHTLGICRAS